MWLDNDSRSGCDFIKIHGSECSLIMIHVRMWFYNDSLSESIPVETT